MGIHADPNPDADPDPQHCFQSLTQFSFIFTKFCSGRVYPAVMWDYYNNGASIRMINPQYFHNRVWRLCATLQVELNMSLQTPFYQGFYTSETCACFFFKLLKIYL
jgi:hypothetical protein